MGNCLCGELSEWGIVQWGIVLVGNCPVGNCPFTVESPSEGMIDPRYLNDVTSSRHSPLINIVPVVLGSCSFLHLFPFCKHALSFPVLL